MSAHTATKLLSIVLAVLVAASVGAQTKINLGTQAVAGSALGTGIIVGNGAAALTAYAGTSCTNQFPRSLNASGAATCNTVTNTDLASTVWTAPGAIGSVTPSTGAFTTILTANGSAATPAYAFANFTNTGLYVNAGVLQVAITGVPVWGFSTAGHLLANTDNTYDIGASGVNRPRTVYAGTSVIAQTQGAEILAGTSTPLGAGGFSGFRANGSSGGIYDLLANGTRQGSFFADGTGVSIWAVGGVQQVNFGTNSAPQWRINSSGHFVGTNDLANDIGVFGATRPRNIYVGSVFTTAPNTQVGASYTVAGTDNTVIANRAGTITMTLPAVATSTGRKLRFVTIQAQTVISAASNVVPLAGGAAGTAILPGTAGKWADLECDGANWIITASN